MSVERFNHHICLSMSACVSCVLVFILCLRLSMYKVSIFTSFFFHFASFIPLLNSIEFRSNNNSTSTKGVSFVEFISSSPEGKKKQTTMLFGQMRVLFLLKNFNIVFIFTLNGVYDAVCFLGDDMFCKGPQTSC